MMLFRRLGKLLGFSVMIVTALLPASGSAGADPVAPEQASATAGINPFLFPAVAPVCSGKTVQPETVRAGQVMFAFVPVGLLRDKRDLPWLNTHTFRSGIVPLSSVTDVVKGRLPLRLSATTQAAMANLLSEAAPFGGVHAAAVPTGPHPVLAAIFGTAREPRTCRFLPTLGLTGQK